MAISPTSDHNRFRPAADVLSANYIGEAPLEINRGPNAIESKTRPNFEGAETNPLADHLVTAASTLVHGYVPVSQGGMVSGKEISAPIAPGYSLSSTINSLVAGNLQNLNRHNRAIQEQENKTVEDAVAKKQLGLESL